MNDRFRFRAWNDKVGFIHFGSDYCNGWEWWDFPDVVKDKGWVVEQCTGLKDKNGRLIYEGDIVKTENNSIYKCVFQMNYGYGINSPCFMLTNEFGHAQSFDDDIEVIGNIHENPELLEDK